LVAHPYPQLDGEMILFQLKPEDQVVPEILVYKDFSLRKRVETVPKVRQSAF
jgi:hypothetical protein